MDSNICPQCQRTINVPINRLIQDTCGHKKCRSCLLREESGCKICFENTVPGNISVIKYDKKSDNIISKNDSEKINACPVKTDLKINQQTENENTEDYEIYKSIAHIIILSKSPLSYKCTICSKSFTTNAAVKYHSYCGGTEKPLKCEICSKGFISRSHLEAHKLKHSGVRPFSCTRCQKTFQQKCKLNRHMKLHTGDRPFICNECGKNFSNKYALTGHVRIHSGDKPFSCKHCGSCFNNKSNLSKHLATHTNERPYMCEECGKKFGNKWTLASHRKCHSFEKPYTCQKCLKSFANIKDLKRHSLIHLDVKPYSCNICSMKFCRKDNLERHLKNTHCIKDMNEIKSATSKSDINKKITKTTAKETVRNIEEPKIYVNMEEENEIVKEKPNAINVIKMQSDSSAPVVNPVKNAVSVINGPFKLAFKTDAFKNNYNILNRNYTEPPPRIQTKKHDMVESLNICQRIFNPTIEPLLPIPAKCENPVDSIKNSPVYTSKNVIMSVGKVNEKDSLEICKKIYAPNDIPPLHYETSFEHKKHADIKNIKFKLPSTYTNNVTKLNSDSPNQFSSEIFQANNELIKSNSFITDHENGAKNYVELQPVKLSYQIDNYKKSVIVNPLSSETIQKESFSDVHWRRRTSQNLQPKISNSL